MAETSQITFSHQEVAEALVKAQNLHEGIWGIYIEFGIIAGNIPSAGDTSLILPAAVVPVVKMGIQRFAEPNNLTVDAAVVNPIPKSKRPTK
ncbi:MAG: hypothetical protein GC179_01925 [Anaerolineaceae bacterium]|nr:hypothetical protein [Anaerolineaceae bacterium]